MKRISIAVVVLACAIWVACESPRNTSSWSTQSPNAPTSSTPVDLGVGPVTEPVDLASLDESKEKTGAALFQAKCSPCHKLDERYIGPALVGVTERRQPAWILNMILNPENMIVNDPTAKSLLATFLTPMANQHLTREEAECVLVYFREHDEEKREAKSTDDTPKTEKEAESGHTADKQ